MQFNLLSFLTIMAILFGNAQYAGFDLFFYFFLPLILILSFISPEAYTMNPFILKKFLFLLVFLVISIFQFFTVEVPYNVNGIYWLWPLKAIIIFSILSFNNFTWPSGNSLLLTMFIIFLVLFGSSSDVTGRFESFFGSNMLYRFFGLLFLVSIFLIDNKLTVIKILLSIFTIILLNLTGSIGAILPVSFAIILLIFNRNFFSNRFSYVALLSIIFSIVLILYFYESSILNRIQYKFFLLEDVPRFIIWSALIDEITLFE